MIVFAKPVCRRPACRSTSRNCTSMARALGICRRVLLERAGLERLYVHILNGALFELVLQLLDHRQWLDDPRVELLYAGDQPDIYTPFFALPAEWCWQMTSTRRFVIAWSVKCT